MYALLVLGNSQQRRREVRAVQEQEGKEDFRDAAAAESENSQDFPLSRPKLSERDGEVRGNWVSRSRSHYTFLSSSWFWF